MTWNEVIDGDVCLSLYIYLHLDELLFMKHLYMATEADGESANVAKDEDLEK